MKHVRSLLVSLSTLLVVAASGCSVDLCDIDEDCLNWPEAICYDGHCANTCYRHEDCYDGHNATSRSNEFCAYTERGYVCLPPYDVANFCRYDSDCNVTGWEYCDRKTSTCMVATTYTTKSDTYGSCYFDRDCLYAEDTCYGGVCMPRCYGDSLNCAATGYYCDSQYDVCVLDPNYSWGAGAGCRDDVDCKDGSTRCYYGQCYKMCHDSVDCYVQGQNGVCDPYQRLCMYY